MVYKIKEVAEIACVSVRTLHHYDEIGLLVPETTSPSGYRLYSSENLERLQQILFFKEIGFSLKEIREIIDRPNFNRIHTLKLHKELLIKKKDRLDEMIQTVEKTIQSIEGGIDLDQKEMFKGFDMKEIEEHQAKFAEETRQKYGHTYAYKESQQRTANYTKDDWATIMKQSEEIYRRIASAMDNGPADPEVQEAVGSWRNHISTYFYNCTIPIFRGLGDLYVNDERFTKNIDKYKEGLASFMREAMHLYCDAHDK